ncbi:unnamed protein product [Soboliphyme baturini]|uniref:Protein transport protein Sec24C n=1 Tax=Soboliphyme baturini TaxID=241478 RepID=A0A183IRD5_9BILA|nr:unnamed protein product [Soboliphyme baturini]
MNEAYRRQDFNHVQSGGRNYPMAGSPAGGQNKSLPTIAAVSGDHFAAQPFMPLDVASVYGAQQSRGSFVGQQSGQGQTPPQLSEQQHQPLQPPQSQQFAPSTSSQEHPPMQSVPPRFMPNAGQYSAQLPPVSSGGGAIGAQFSRPSYSEPMRQPPSFSQNAHAQPPPTMVSNAGVPPQRQFDPSGAPAQAPPFITPSAGGPQRPQFLPPGTGAGQQLQPPPFMSSAASGQPPSQFLSNAANQPSFPSQQPPFGPGPAAPPQTSLTTMGGGFPPTAIPPPMQPGPGGPMAPSAAPASRRLDPNLMPSAVRIFSCDRSIMLATKVIEDDRRARSGNFPTGFPTAELPPLATTDYFAEDNGNCNPKFMRATLYNVPINSDLVKQTALPMGICVCPTARLSDQENPLPIVNFGDLGPVRCHRCKAYMCPFMEFFDGGRHFKCPICTASTEVPTEYFAHLDYTGRRVDYMERPELHFGSYEFVATKEYCKDGIFPKPPACIFMIDVSYNAVHNGIVGLLCQNLKSLLRSLPKESNNEASMMEVGFITYDHALHFYDLKSNPGQLKMLVVNDVSEMFLPLEEGFLVKPSQAESAIDALAEHIFSMFADNKITEVVLGPVVQAGVEAFKALGRPGKVFVFHSVLPVFDAPGKLKNRDDRKLLGTEKEKTILTPQSEFYTKLAQDCVSVGCCVDMFLFPNSYMDVATVGSLCGLTGGQVFKYQYFQPEIDGPRFLADLRNDIQKPILFDAVMRLRTSSGIRPTDFYGSFFMSNTTDVEMAAVDCDKCVTIEIKHDDKIDGTAAFFQAAVLYTSVSGERRIRIHNLSLATAPDFHAIYRSADIFAVVNFLAKQAERTQLQKTPREVRENLVTRCAQILATYRQYCSPASSMGQLVLPETLKLLPLFTISIIKNDALSGGSDLATDDRAWLMQLVPPLRVFDTVYFFYPRLFSVSELDDSDDFPESVRCSYENLAISSSYILENGVLMFLWIGSGIDSQWLEQVFGVSSLTQLNCEKNIIPEKDNITSRRLRRLIDRLQTNRQRCLKLFIVKQKDKLEPWFRKFLIEDNLGDSVPSYVDFLCQIHKEIRNILS